MRRIITLAAGITLAVTVSAQTLSSNVKVPRPQAPGMEFSIENAINKDGNFTMTKFKTLPKPHFETAPRAPRLVDTDGDITTKDTLLAVGHLKKDSYGSGEYQSETVTYDKFGRRATYTKFDSRGRVEEAYKYTYEVGPFNFWTTKYVQKKDRSDSDWSDYSKEEREIDENKNITRKKDYSLGYLLDPNTGMYSLTLILTSDVSYDYSHAYKEYEDGPEKRGYEVERYTYDKYRGNLVSHTKYEWSDLAKQYILVLDERSDSKTETIITDNSIEQKLYRKSSASDGTFVLAEYNVSYYENGDYAGYKHIYYNEDGTVESVYGQKITTEHDTPSLGWTTETSYDYDKKSDSFIPRARIEYKGKPSSNSYTAADYSANYYYYVGGQWEYNHSVIQEILDHRIYKITQKDASAEYISYKKLDEDNRIVGSVTYDSDGSYQVRYDSQYDNEHNIHYRIIEYYDANSTLLKTVCALDGLRQYMGIEGYHPDDDSEIYTYYEKKGDNWEAVKEYEVKESYYDSNSMRRVYQFTDEGYPSTITRYVQNSSYNGGKEFMSEKIVYTYADNGYKVDEYGIWSLNNLTLELEGSNTYYILEDGSIEHTYYEYDDEVPGALASGERTITYNDGSQDFYNYDTKTGEWSLFNSSRPGFQEYVYDFLDDGTRIITQRRQGDNDEIINVAKSVSYEKDEDGISVKRNEEYVWDEANNEWKGVEKSEESDETVHFGISATNPIAIYDDEYMPHEERSTNNYSLYFESKKYYAWNENTKDWQLYNKENEDNKDYSYQIDGNKLTYSVSNVDNDAIRKNYGEVLLNDKQQVVSENITEQYTSREYGDSEEDKHLTTYTYNKYGSWEERNQDTYIDGHLISSDYDKYIYEEAQIIPTLIKQLPLSEVAKGFSVDGLKVNHEGIILLYNADGRLTAKGNGFVIAPEPGLYVIKAEGKTLKMMLK